jgi:2-methylisocitrate lyase-like PEP mutase family enzyme
MTVSVPQKRAAFRQLHQSGCFVIPNPWDAGSARFLQSQGFKALASTSAGYAWSAGRPDYGVRREDLLAHLTALVEAVDLPINADFEGGFADEPAGVAASVRLAVGTGVAGLSIEDRKPGAGAGLYDFDLAVERIRATRAAIDSDDSGVVLVARSEGFLVGAPDMDETIRRLRAFAEAGADCLYAPGIRTAEQIGAVVQGVAPTPVNVLSGGSGLIVTELGALGVRRVSVGGSFAFVAYQAFAKAAKQLAETGAFERGAATLDLNAVFAAELAKRDDG